MNQGGEKQLDIYAQISQVPFTDAVLKIRHQTSNGNRIHILPLPVCPQKFISFLPEKEAISDGTAYSVGSQKEIRVKPENYESDLEELLKMLFPNAHRKSQYMYLGVFNFFKKQLRFRYEIQVKSSNMIDFKLFGHSQDQMIGESKLYGHLLSLMWNFEFLLS